MDDDDGEAPRGNPPRRYRTDDEALRLMVVMLEATAYIAEAGQQSALAAWARALVAVLILVKFLHGPNQG